MQLDIKECFFHITYTFDAFQFPDAGLSLDTWSIGWKTHPMDRFSVGRGS